MPERFLWHDYFLEMILEAQDPKKPLGPMAGRRRKDPVPRWYVPQMLEHLARGRERAKRERKEKTLAEAIKRDGDRRRRSPHNTRAPHRIVDKIMRAMEPGHWYGLKALSRAAGMGSSEAGRASQVLQQRAWATRVRNPAWDPRPVSPQQIMAGAEREPQWLYQLTVAGVVEKQRVAELMQGDPIEALF